MGMVYYYLTNITVDSRYPVRSQNLRQTDHRPHLENESIPVVLTSKATSAKGTRPVTERCVL